MTSRPQTTRRQHLISKSLLAQFAGASGRLIAFGIAHRSVDYKHPSQVGYELDFISNAPMEAEELWQSTERHLPNALRAMEAGHALEDATHLQTLKDTIALHYFRRAATKLVIESMIDRRVEERATSYVNENPLPGVPPDRLAAALHARVEAERAAWLQEGIQRMFADARDMLSQSAGLEVFTSTGDELLLGDSAVISCDSDGRLGMRPFRSAASQLLPVGRRHLIALGPHDEEFDLPSDFVVRCNQAQVRYARSRVFFHPDSGLETFVRSALDAT